MANNVTYIIELKDRFARIADKTASRFDKLRVRAVKAAAGVGRFASNMRRAASESSKMRGEAAAALGVLAVSMGIVAKKLVDKSIEMEDAIADVARVTSGTDKQFKDFEGTLESMSEKLGKSKLGLAQMAFEGGKLGTTLKDMEPFLMMVSKTAIAFDMADEEAGRAIGSIQAKMGLMNDETQKLLDSMNFLADTTTANGARMVDILERTSGTMSLLKVPPEAVASLVAIADQLEVSGELAASGLNMFFGRMERFPGMVTKLMNDPLGATREVLQKISAMGPEVQANFIRKAFGDESGRFVKKMVANIELFDKSVENAFSLEAVGSMNRELENQLARSSKTIQVFSETTKNTMQSIGDALKPMFAGVAKLLTPVIDGIGNFVKQNPKIAQLAATFATVTVAVAGLAAALVAIKFAFALIGGTVVIVIGIIAGIVTAIIALATHWDEVVAFMKSAFNSFIEGVKNLFQSFVNFWVSKINSLLTPISMISETLGFDSLVIPELKFDTPEAPTMNTNLSDNSKADVQVTVKAEEGAKVTQTKSKVMGRSLALGVNMQ